MHLSSKSPSCPAEKLHISPILDFILIDFMEGRYAPS